MQSSNEIKNKAIGVIDSGIGGLTVMSEILKSCPNEKLVYVGDDINSPYGEKSTEDIQQLSLSLISRPELSNIKALVIACNTITAAAYDEIEKATDVPVIGVINSGVSAAMSATKNNKIGILATSATVNSGVYDKYIKEANPAAAITSVPAPELHLMAENHLDQIVNEPSDGIIEMVKRHIEPFVEAGCDTVLLACTHFPPYGDIIKNLMGPGVNVVDPSKNTAQILKQQLEQNGIEAQGNGGFEIISTAGNDVKFKQFSELIFK